MEELNACFAENNCIEKGKFDAKSLRQLIGKAVRQLRGKAPAKDVAEYVKSRLIPETLQ
jgi:Asp-tRNA(Asn)/Glu-tRNA(Gln) amidotransferase B subunit